MQLATRTVLGILVLSMLATGAVAQEDSQVFIIEFTISQDDVVTNTSARIAEGERKIPGRGSGDYVIQLQDDNGQTLYKMPTQIMFYIPHIGEQEEVEYKARLPYMEQATSIQLTRNEAVITEVSVPQHVCPDTSDGECSAYCDGKGVDPDCAPGILERVLGNTLLLGGLLLLALIAGFLYFSMVPENETGNRLQQQ